MGKTNRRTNESRVCPCGSGEKYEKCCGIPPKVVDFARARWRKTAQELRRRLGEYADREVFLEEANEAQDMYLAGLDPDLVDHEDEFTLERCFEWFIFDYRLPDGRTVLERFASEEVAEETEEQERTLLRQWRDARLSVHEVLEVRPGEGIVVKDLVTREVVPVHDVSAVWEIEQGSILFMRVLPVGDEYEFSTSGLALPGSYRDVLMFHLQRDLQNYLKTRGATVNRYLAERAHVINKWVVDLGLLNRQPLWKGDGARRDPLSARLAQKLTNAFLDDYYERWLDRNIPALGGRTPRDISRTALGRQKLEELLRELDLIEEGRARRGEPHYDINRVRAKLGLALAPPKRVAARARRTEPATGHLWPKGDYGDVARAVSSGMRELGFDQRQEGAALQLWYDYCSKERPLVRKAPVWSASVVYTMSRLELNDRVKQKDLAEFFGVAISSISVNFRSLCRSLGLSVFDSRYATRSSPLKGRTGRIPLLDFLVRGGKP